jgi:hypothetical protein
MDFYDLSEEERDSYRHSAVNFYEKNPKHFFEEARKQGDLAKRMVSFYQANEAKYGRKGISWEEGFETQYSFGSSKNNSLATLRIKPEWDEWGFDDGIFLHLETPEDRGIYTRIYSNGEIFVGDDNIRNYDDGTKHNNLEEFQKHITDLNTMYSIFRKLKA